MGAAALLDQVQADGYRGWQRVPGWETRQPSVSVHGQTADIFMNEVLALALMTPNLTAWPVGSLPDEGLGRAMIAWRLNAQGLVALLSPLATATLSASSATADRAHLPNIAGRHCGTHLSHAAWLWLTPRTPMEL